MTYKKTYLADPDEVEKLWEESTDQPPLRVWEACDGDCVNLDEYELPKSVRDALADDKHWQFTALSHYRICNNDNDLIEDRLFLFIDLEPVAIWITYYNR